MFQPSASRVSAPSLCVWLLLACSTESDEPTEALPPVIVGEKVTIQSTVTAGRAPIASPVAGLTTSFIG